jgi:hypothetical protein
LVPTVVIRIWLARKWFLDMQPAVSGLPLPLLGIAPRWEMAAAVQ